MNTGTYAVTTTDGDVVLRVSTVSATTLQLTAWQELWDRLLARASAGAVVSAA
jgi:hypothetical protein